jgi:hypothetical protein
MKLITQKGREMNRPKVASMKGILLGMLGLIVLASGCIPGESRSSTPQSLVLERSVASSDDDARPMAKLNVKLTKRYRGVRVEATYTNGSEFVLMPSRPQMLEVLADRSRVYVEEDSTSADLDIPLPAGESRLWTADCDLPVGAENIEVSVGDWYAVEGRGKPSGLKIGPIEIAVPLSSVPGNK